MTDDTDLHVCGIGGPPAVGKSTLVLRLLREYGAFRRFDWGLCKGRLYDDAGLAVLGRYDDDAFGGTDRLAMHAIDDAEDFIATGAGDSHTPFTHVLFEGDRLYNDRFLDHCADHATCTEYVVLTAPDDVLDSRHAHRDDDQDMAWVRGRRTKYAALAERDDVATMPHCDADDMDAVEWTLRAFLPDVDAGE